MHGCQSFRATWQNGPHEKTNKNSTIRNTQNKTQVVVNIIAILICVTVKQLQQLISFNNFNASAVLPVKNNITSHVSSDIPAHQESLLAGLFTEKDVFIMQIIYTHRPTYFWEIMHLTWEKNFQLTASKLSCYAIQRNVSRFSPQYAFIKMIDAKFGKYVNKVSK